MSIYGGVPIQELYFIVKKHVNAKVWKFCHGDPFRSKEEAEEEIKHLEILTDIMVYKVMKFRPTNLKKE